MPAFCPLWASIRVRSKPEALPSAQAKGTTATGAGL